MTLDEFFAEADRLGCRMVSDNPAEVRAAFDAKDAEIASLQAQLAASQEQVVELADELRNIANANPTDWGDLAGDFQPWAQNRAHAALSKVSC